jgi:hypothetical protein
VTAPAADRSAAGGHYNAADGTFRKTMTDSAAAAELRGYRSVAGHLPVPRLVGAHPAISGVEIAYEDIFASGRCHRLLAEAINAADRDPSQLPAVRTFVEAICDSMLTAADSTGSQARLADCNPDLYATRLAPGGRIDTWYTNLPRPMWTLDRRQLSLDDLAAHTLIVHGTALGAAFPLDLEHLRAQLSADSPWATTLSQGDPTEPNIAEPLCWLDFEHAGRNTLAGDLAILLWYLLAMGGWLVPTYQPLTYARTLPNPLPPTAQPTVDDLAVHGRHVEINYSWRVGPGRRAAIQTLLHRLDHDLGVALQSPTDPLRLLRPFLILRVLGVIPLARMTGPHALLCLTKLAELDAPNITLRTWCLTVLS